MKKNGWAGALVAFLCGAAPSLADTRITTKYTADGETVEATIYAKGARLRYDYGKGLILLRQCDQKRVVQIDQSAKTFASLPEEPPAAPGPSKVSLANTGEHKEMFGYSARHVKRIESVEGKKDRTETDGLYIDLKDVAACSGQDASSASLGYPVAYTITAYGENGKVASTITMVVTGLVNAPLDAALFEIPAGYTDSAAKAGSGSASPKTPGGTRIGVVAMRNRSNGATQYAGAYSHLMAQLQEAKFDVVPLADGSAEAIGRKAQDWQCDYVLYTEVAGVEKQATGKVGGFLHHAPGIGKVTGGDVFEARVDYRLAPAGSGSPVLASSAIGKTGGQFNWKAAAMLASNVVPMTMAAKMMGGMMNPGMMNALMSGRGCGASMTSVDPMMSGMSMFLKGSNLMPGPGGTAPPDPTAGDAAIGSAIDQEANAIIAQLRTPAAVGR